MARRQIPLPGGAVPVATGPLDLLIDEMLDWYVEWGEATVAAADAYRLWSAGPAGHKAALFAAYSVALDEEEYTATAYAQALIKVTNGR